MGENRRKTLSTTLHTSWESMRVNPIFLTHLAEDVSHANGQIAVNEHLQWNNGNKVCPYFKQSILFSLFPLSSRNFDLRDEFDVVDASDGLKLSPFAR